MNILEPDGYQISIIMLCSNSMQVRLGANGWKERYYKVKFSAESIESKRKEVVRV